MIHTRMETTAKTVATKAYVSSFFLVLDLIASFFGYRVWTHETDCSLVASADGTMQEDRSEILEHPLHRTVLPYSYNPHHSLAFDRNHEALCREDR